MFVSGYGVGVFIWQNKNPTAGLGSGVPENFAPSEPNRRASRQERVEEQVQIQIQIHGQNLANRPARVKLFFVPLW
jgi:hypothetical protein